MKMKQKLYWSLLLLLPCFVCAQNVSQYFTNPILSGFNPDPSICRVNDDYYMVTSSFSWYPGLPIYHSKDLVNWELISHALNRPDMINMGNLNDNDGIWAPTIRYHNGLFYIAATANQCGGNFYITATDPKSSWSDPIWLKDAPGIDPSLFWDDNGKCYYTGNRWDFKGSWPLQCAVWMQELDIDKGEFVGERKILTYGHANNAAHAEGPHIYKIDNRYLLLMSEGGTNMYHAVSAHQSKFLWGPYVADKINPVLTHRHLGNKYPIQSIGHADLIQTQNEEWYAIVLGKRMIDGYAPLGRETFLCKVEFEDGIPIFNPGHGIVLSEQERPNLPWSPVRSEPERDEFDTDKLALKWYFVRIPQKPFHSLEKGKLSFNLQPEVIDSLENSAMIIQKVKHQTFMAMMKLDFRTKKDNEQAGLIFYRTANGYYSLMKHKSTLVLTKKYLGKKEVVAQIPYIESQVCLKVEVDGLEVKFSAGENPDNLISVGGVQLLDAVSDNRFNKFNGTGVGMYATSSGKKSSNKAYFDWFECKPKE